MTFVFKKKKKRNRFLGKDQQIKWATAGIKKSYVSKNQLYHKYIKKPTVGNKERYKKQSKILQGVCMKAKGLYYHLYYHDLINTGKLFVKSLSGTFSPMMCNKNRQANKIHKITPDNIEITKSKDMATHSMIFFAQLVSQ